MTATTQTVSWWRTNFGDDEARAIAEAIRHEHISQGPVVREFEARLAQYLGVPHVVATTNGSTALLMALMAVGVGPGDEVIVPNRTWISTAHAPALLGATVKLIDVEKDRPIIDAGLIEAAISPRTKAIMPVHLNGRAADMAAIRRIAATHGLAVIEDAAQALGSRNADGLLGTQSDIGCFSLSVAKIIATGQGGFMATRDPALYERLVSIRTHGVTSVINAEWTRLGFNFRFTDILAAIGLVQLEQLQPRIEKVKAIQARYLDAAPALPFLTFLPVDVRAGEVPIYVEALCPERSRLIKFLADRGIETRPFYPDLHHAPYFNSHGAFPRSSIFSEQGVFLPSGPGQSLDVIDGVIAVLRSFS
jgi:perosamine synthetase